eukprot:3038213-Rhodomonas_salina.1
MEFHGITGMPILNRFPALNLYLSDASRNSYHCTSDGAILVIILLLVLLVVVLHVYPGTLLKFHLDEEDSQTMSDCVPKFDSFKSARNSRVNHDGEHVDLRQPFTTYFSLIAYGNSLHLLQ